MMLHRSPYKSYNEQEQPQSDELELSIHANCNVKATRTRSEPVSTFEAFTFIFATLNQLLWHFDVAFGSRGSLDRDLVRFMCALNHMTIFVRRLMDKFFAFKIQNREIKLDTFCTLQSLCFVITNVQRSERVSDEQTTVCWTAFVSSARCLYRRTRFAINHYISSLLFESTVS